MPFWSKSKPKSDEKTSLLGEDDDDSSSFDMLSDDLDDDHLSDDLDDDPLKSSGKKMTKSLDKEIKSVRQRGRKARTSGEKMHHTRSEEVREELIGIGFELGCMVADAFLPGLGAGISGSKTVYEVRKEVKEGEGGKKTLAKHTAKTGAGFIPVVGEFLGIAEGAGKICKSTLQTGKSRTNEKVEAAKKMKRVGEGELIRISMLEDEVAELEEGKDKTTCQGRLQKAKDRWRLSIQQIDEWVAKKSEKGTLPLLSGLDDDWDPFGDDLDSSDGDFV